MAVFQLDYSWIEDIREKNVKNGGFLHFFTYKSKKAWHYLYCLNSLIIKTKGYKMLKNYENWLVEHGFSAFTASGKRSSIYDYLRSLKMVSTWEGKSIEELADSISEIAPMYYKTGVHCVKGRMVSRSVRCSLRQFNKFVMEQRA